MNDPLTPEQFEALCRLDACTLANAIETFHEQALIALCRSPEFSLEKLRAEMLERI